MNIARQISMVAIVAIGMTFVLIIGEIDLSVGHIACLSGIIVAKCLTLNMGIPSFLPDGAFGRSASGICQRIY